MVVLAVVWKANESHEREVAEIFHKLEAASRQETGCLMYIVHRHTKDHGRFFIYEQYEDEAALSAHRHSQHFHRYALEELPKVATRVEGELYEPLGEV